MGTHPESDPGGPEAIRRDLADALAILVYSALPDLRLDFANRGALGYFGIDLGDISGVHWLEHVHPADRAAVLAAWEGSSATGQPYRHEHRLRLGDGPYRRFLAQALPLRDERGAIVKWYGVLTPTDGPRLRGPRPRAAKVDYYPLRDASGQLQLVEVATWEDRPDEPAAKLHPGGSWYRVTVVAGSGWHRGDSDGGE